jgi:N-acetyl-alpha-D-muramate 1-phosphate uridylyltransferase
MKAMILAAGKGERMLPLTVDTPKPLMLVRGDPLIVHHLRNLAKAGISDVVVNVWYLAEKLVGELGDGSSFGVKIHYLVEKQLLNTGGGIVNALPYLGSAPFLVMSADVYTDFPIASLPTAPASLAHLVMVDNPEYHQAGDFVLDKGQIKLSGTDKLCYANIGIFRPEFFVGAPLGPFPLGELMRQHILNGLVTGQYYNGLWYNVGTPAELEMVNTYI